MAVTRSLSNGNTVVDWTEEVLDIPNQYGYFNASGLFTGAGVATGGTTGQVLTKVSGTNYDTTWSTPAADAVTSVAGRTGAIVLTVADVSGAAPLASPSLTGDPTAPTPATNDNDTSIATTAFVKAQGYITDAPSDGSYYMRKDAAWDAVTIY